MTQKRTSSRVEEDEEEEADRNGLHPDTFPFPYEGYLFLNIDDTFTWSKNNIIFYTARLPSSSFGSLLLLLLVLPPTPLKSSIRLRFMIALSTIQVLLISQFSTPLSLPYHSILFLFLEKFTCLAFQQRFLFIRFPFLTYLIDEKIYISNFVNRTNNFSLLHFTISLNFLHLSCFWFLFVFWEFSLIGRVFGINIDSSFDSNLIIGV